MNRFFRMSLICLALLLAFSVYASPIARAEEVPTSYKDALEYAREKQPMFLDLGKVKLKMEQLLKIRSALPENAEIKFSVKWQGLTITNEDTELDLTKIKRNLTVAEIENLISLCPNVKTIDNSTHKEPSNDDMLMLIEKYPDIHFEWVIHLGKGKKDYFCATNSTAWTTANKNSAPHKLTGEDLELLQYVPGLKAIDIGHNIVTSLDFLRFFPDLELLIIGGNPDLADLTPVGQLTHLKYLEVFDCLVEDLSPLANCKELLDLNVTNTKVTDLTPLDEITTLERFWCNQNKQVTEEQREHFTQAHPDCKAVFDGRHATSDNWRKHERYTHYRKCFKNKQWIPFSEMAAGK